MENLNHDERSRVGRQQKLAYSVDELVASVPVGRTTVYAEIKAGRLNTIKIGRRTLILAAEVERWLAHRAI